MPGKNHSTHDPFEAPVYWALMLLGLGGLALGVLLPEWRELQRLRSVERTHWNDVEALREDLERERDVLDALQSDPAVIARVARRELNYRHPYDRFVQVAVEPGRGERRSFDGHGALEAAGRRSPGERRGGASVDTPVWVGLDCGRLLADGETRRTVLLLSAGLLAVAAGLFWRRPRNAVE